MGKEKSGEKALFFRRLVRYNKKVNENGFSYNAYKRRMMVFNKYINNPKVCTSKVNTNFVKPKN